VVKQERFLRRVRSPKCRPIFCAIFGPTPLINPDPRYFSRARRVGARAMGVGKDTIIKNIKTGAHGPLV
jgi:hypothetical protein